MLLNKDEKYDYGDKEMNEINIMTWNVDWFRNGIRSGENYEYIYEDCSQDICDLIIDIVKGFLENNNAIVFLQEVPYMRFDENKMVKHELWNRLELAFPNNQYDIFTNTSKKKVLRYTVAVAKKDVYAQVKGYQPENNRTVAVKKFGITLMGVHMPTAFKDGTDDARMWNNLIELAKKCDGSKETLIVAGDFNAFIGCKDINANKMYRKLKTYTEDVVPPLLKTFADATTGDHILLNAASMKKFIDCRFNYEIERRYSDHIYLVTKFIW